MRTCIHIYIYIYIYIYILGLVLRGLLGLGVMPGASGALGFRLNATSQCFGAVGVPNWDSRTSGFGFEGLLGSGLMPRPSVFLRLAFRASGFGFELKGAPGFRFDAGCRCFSAVGVPTWDCRVRVSSRLRKTMEHVLKKRQADGFDRIDKKFNQLMVMYGTSLEPSRAGEESTSLSLSLSIYISLSLYIYIYIHTCMYTYIYIHIDMCISSELTDLWRAVVAWFETTQQNNTTNR